MVVIRFMAIPCCVGCGVFRNRLLLCFTAPARCRRPVTNYQVSYISPWESTEHAVWRRHCRLQNINSTCASLSSPSRWSRWPPCCPAALRPRTRIVTCRTAIRRCVCSFAACHALWFPLVKRHSLINCRFISLIFDIHPPFLACTSAPHMRRFLPCSLWPMVASTLSCSVATASCGACTRRMTRPCRGWTGRPSPRRARGRMTRSARGMPSFFAFFPFQRINYRNLVHSLSSCLNRNASRNVANTTNCHPSPRRSVFDADPTIGRNSDGRLEIFIRFHNNLDLWQMYMTDPMDPESWTTPREPSCVDQDQKTGLWACLCPPIDKFLRCSYPDKHYWYHSSLELAFCKICACMAVSKLCDRLVSDVDRVSRLVCCAQKQGRIARVSDIRHHRAELDH